MSVFMDPLRSSNLQAYHPLATNSSQQVASSSNPSGHVFPEQLPNSQLSPDTAEMLDHISNNSTNRDHLFMASTLRTLIAKGDLTLSRNHRQGADSAQYGAQIFDPLKGRAAIVAITTRDPSSQYSITSVGAQYASGEKADFSLNQYADEIIPPERGAYRANNLADNDSRQTLSRVSGLQSSPQHFSYPPQPSGASTSIQSMPFSQRSAGVSVGTPWPSWPQPAHSARNEPYPASSRRVINASPPQGYEPRLPSEHSVDTSTFAASQPTQLGGTQTQRVPLERKQSLEQLVKSTILNAQVKRRGKNSPAVMTEFGMGVETLNAKPGKTLIDPRAATAFYKEASADRTPLPEAVLAESNARKAKLAKKRYGPAATANDYVRSNKEKLAKKQHDPTATATAADYDRTIKERLAKKMFGLEATAANYNRTTKKLQAVRELGPTATPADLAKIQATERDLAAKQGVNVKELRRRRRENPASMQPSFPGPNQREYTPGHDAGE
jgi:hypothetical protein